MKRAILIIGVIVICSSVSFAQTKSDSLQLFQSQIMNLEKLNSKLLKQVIAANSNFKKIEQRLSATADSLSVLKKEFVLTNNHLEEIEKNLVSQIQQLSYKTSSDLSTLNNRLSRNTNYFILAVILMILLTSILVGWLKSIVTREKKILLDKIIDTTEALRDELKRPDNKLNGLHEPQIKLTDSEQQKPEDIDHTLALKVADEIFRIKKNLNSIDPETKGLKHIEFALERMQDYFNEYGYEMVELINRPYDKGMKISAEFIPDKALKHGEQIITAVFKPQINFKGVIIQLAEVEVSVGE